MSSLLIGFDQFLPGQDAIRILEALLPQKRPCSFLIWTSLGRAHRKRSESGWATAWRQFTSDWSRRISKDRSSPDLLTLPMMLEFTDLLNNLPKLLTPSYSDVVIFGPAPRSALSTACARALRIALLSLKNSRLIWVDLSPNPSKSATLAFSRTLLKSNGSLIAPDEVETHLTVFRPETLGIAPPNTVNIFKSTLMFPDCSQISIRTHNIKSRVDIRYAVNVRDCRRALITGDAELDSSAAWISLRKLHPSLCNLYIRDLVAVVQFDNLCGILFPIKDLVFFVLKIDVDVHNDIISKLQRFDLLPSAVHNPRVYDETFNFRGEFLSDLDSVSCDAVIESDYVTVGRERDDISVRLHALRQSKEQGLDRPVAGFEDNSPIAALSSFFKQILDERKDIVDAPSEIRNINRMQQSTLDKRESQHQMAESLEKALAAQPNLSESIPGIQLQMVVAFEIARFRDSQDPLEERTIAYLQDNAAKLSVMFAGSASMELENFLNTILVYSYGVKFPLTLLGLYDHMDLEPPDSLSRADDDEISSQTVILPEAETFTDAVNAGLPESPSSSSKNLLMLKTNSNLLELVAQESCLKRRRTVSCFSSRLDNQVKWSRSFPDRDPKRRRSDSNFFMLAEKSSSIKPLQVLVEASPARAFSKTLASQREAKLMFSSGPMISESPQFSSKAATIASTFQKDLSLGTPNVRRVLTFDDC